MTESSVRNYNDKLNIARTKLNDLNEVLKQSLTVTQINEQIQNANNTKDELNRARQNLTVDKQPLINAKLLCNKV